MLEDINLVELYRSTKPKKLLICSYTLDLSYLERELINDFRNETDTKIYIITSEIGLSESINEGFSVSGVGIDYYLYTVKDFPYAFHPKIFLYKDQQDDIGLYVSGANFTYPGLSLNMDAVDFIPVSFSNPICRQNIVEFLNNISSIIDDKSLTKFTSNLILDIESKQISEHNGLFISNCSSSIKDQILKHSMSSPIKLRVISPYYDHNFYALKELIHSYGNLKTEILFNNKDSAINLALKPKNVHLYVSSEKHRHLHAKIYLLYGNKTADIIVGSTNCTSAGLLSKRKEGNWEASVITRNASLKYADDLWLSFNPKILSPKTQWKYIQPEKRSNKHNLLFNAIMEYNQIIIKPISGFPNNKYTINVGLSSRSGFSLEQVIQVNNNSEFSINITSHEMELLNEEAIQIILQLDDKNIGANWVIQTHILRKSFHIRKLENIVYDLKHDRLEGWEEMYYLIQFISKNMTYISPKHVLLNENNSQTATSAGQSQKIPTINGIYDIDYPIDFKDSKVHLGDMMELGRLINNLFKEGIQSDPLPTEEEIEDIGKNNKPAEKKKNDKRTKDTKYNPNLVSIRLQVMNNIPPFSEIIENNITGQFLEDISNKNYKLNELKAKYTAFIDLVTFCYKLIRFLRIDLALITGSNNIKANVQIYFLETILLFKKFIKVTYDYVLKELTEDEVNESIYNAGLSSLFLQFAIELSITNSIPSINRKLLKEFLIFIKSSRFFEFIKSQYVQNIENEKVADIFSLKILLQKRNIDELIELIINYPDGFEDKRKIIEKYIKYHYWEEAFVHHSEALDYLDKNKSDNSSLMSKHSYRIQEAQKKMNNLRTMVKIELGELYSCNIFNKSKLHGISEIETDENFQYLCPECESFCELDIFIQLMEYRIICCNSCNSLILPVNLPPRYEYKYSDPKEWREE